MKPNPPRARPFLQADLFESATALAPLTGLHPFRVIKRQFRHMRVHYSGLAKNTASPRGDSHCPVA